MTFEKKLYLKKKKSHRHIRICYNGLRLKLPDTVPYIGNIIFNTEWYSTVRYRYFAKFSKKKFWVTIPEPLHYGTGTVCYAICASLLRKLDYWFVPISIIFLLWPLGEYKRSTEQVLYFTVAALNIFLFLQMNRFLLKKK